MKTSRIISFPITLPFGGVENTVCPTLLQDEKETVLIDCGYIGALPVLEKELGKHGVSVSDITGLVLTHHDHDHMGAAAALKKKNSSIIIYASAAEAPFISWQEKPLRLLQAENLQITLPPEMQEFGRSFCDMLRRVEPVEVDVILEDGARLDWCGGCRILATPGHTPGHISLLVENEDIVITGDAFAIEDGWPVLANPQFTLDLEQATRSMNMLLSLPAKVYYCSHGGAFIP